MSRLSGNLNNVMVLFLGDRSDSIFYNADNILLGAQAMVRKNPLYTGVIDFVNTKFTQGVIYYNWFLRLILARKLMWVCEYNDILNRE